MHIYKVTNNLLKSNSKKKEEKKEAAPENYKLPQPGAEPYAMNKAA